MRSLGPRLVRRVTLAGLLAFCGALLAASPAPTVTLDGSASSTEEHYVAAPRFGASRANTGVAIHQISDPRLLDAVKDVGFSFVRTDLFWEAVQAQDGWHYGEFDGLVSNLQARGLGALFILGYKHYLFSPDQPPTTAPQLAAFRTYVHQSVYRYRNAPVRFEVWNEQDHKDYWLAPPSPRAYRALLETAVSAAHQANPDVTIATGGVQQVDRDFIRAVGDMSASKSKSGPDAVSVHPYRQQYPETVLGDYAALREDLSTYQKRPHVWATEWSYPTYAYDYVKDIGNGHAPEARARQAKYAVRLFLMNWMAQVGLTSYYDMRNDGRDPKEMEHNFGLLDADNAKLPAYHAVKHLFGFTAGVKNARYFMDDAEKIAVLKFETGGATKYVVWCYGAGNVMNVDVSRLPANAVVTDMYGKPITGRGVLAVTEAQGPVFVTAGS
ncbi:cellulase family glycosylhydrolase [Caballeronia sp. LZ035]|uniref:cellulase family glycosylhydrolase n=1 Tax=Caballeronia sp. LZ035 TaxID=3038568 RepID=UPI00285AAE13|nr:cellulase family glycosylhydrolase [Caballeronia sp. LZ035]MDR5757164.1 cellulase family glycosylhydrolase [Caballeronia sp. LZ035]